MLIRTWFQPRMLLTVMTEDFMPSRNISASLLQRAHWLIAERGSSLKLPLFRVFSLMTCFQLKTGAVPACWPFPLLSPDLTVWTLKVSLLEPPPALHG